MEISFLGQPFPDSGQLGSEVRSALSEGQFDRAWFVTAWGKQSGLSRIAAELESFRGRGGVAEIVLGVDEGGATVEGLRLAQSLFDSASIFHDPGARTFHPKMYVVQGPRSATALIGSGNLTRGGLFTNYEAAVRASLDLSDPSDSEFVEQMRVFYEQLVDTPFAKPLTEELIEDLVRDPRIRLLSEKRANQARSKRKSEQGQGESVFGTSGRTGLLGAPPPDLEAIEGEEDDDDSVAGDESESGRDLIGRGSSPGDEAPTPKENIEGDVGQTVLGTKGFFKALSKWDVSATSAPGQIVIPRKYLPFFGDLTVFQDDSADGGVRNSDHEFSLTFRDGSFEKDVSSARVILYEPAEAQKRKNPEVRFTFTDHEINPGRLKKGDVLVFRRENDGVVVERQSSDWRPPGVGMKSRFGAL